MNAETTSMRIISIIMTEITSQVLTIPATRLRDRKRTLKCISTLLLKTKNQAHGKITRCLWLMTKRTYIKEVPGRTELTGWFPEHADSWISVNLHHGLDSV